MFVASIAIAVVLAQSGGGVAPPGQSGSGVGNVPGKVSASTGPQGSFAGWSGAFAGKKATGSALLRRTSIYWKQLVPITLAPQGFKTSLKPFECPHAMIDQFDGSHDRPIVFFVTCPTAPLPAGIGGAPASGSSPTFKDPNQAMEKLFQDERIRALAIACFETVKVDGGMPLSLPVVKEWLPGKAMPRLVIYTADHQAVAILEKNVSTGDLYDAMVQALETNFAVDADELAREFAALRQQAVTLEDRIASLDARIDAGGAKASLTKERVKLTEQLSGVESRMIPLYAPPKRPAETAATTPVSSKS